MSTIGANPRELQQPVSKTWWLERGSYFAFMMRELSCVFVAWFVVYLVMLIRAVSAGATGYGEFLEWSAGPAIMLLNLVSLAFVIFHAVTFFNAAPQALVVSAGGTRVPPVVIAASHYAAWLVVSAVVCWLLIGV